MVVVEIEPGACGMKSVIQARPEGREVKLVIESDCPAVKELAAELTVLGMRQVLAGFGQGPVFELAGEHLQHAACLVPAGIIKAAEVALGLNVPRPSSIIFAGQETDSGS
jgi:hypothetical protein